MNKKRLLFVLIVIIAVSITARWWLPALLQILHVNGNLIQAMDSFISIISSVITILSAIWGYLIIRDGNKETETIDQRNRRIMLDHVENFWIKGILEKSLYGAALLELGIKEETEAVKKYPWGIKRETTDELLPSNMSMLDIFKQIGNGRSLLMLGDPGSGKTTMLLDLTRKLIELARQDETEPIPLLLNLATWNEQQSLSEWLVTELNGFYEFPKKIASNWLYSNSLFLLLDGLDEVKHENRSKCIEAVNYFRRDHGLINIVVCSRNEEYAELKTHLAFSGAIGIQLLSQDQIAAYFKRFGSQLSGVRQILQKDTFLHEMAKTPLFLNIMSLAYHDMSAAEIPDSANMKVQRKHLFNTYIARMFNRPGRAKNVRFSQYDVIRLLSWLAKKMITYNQTPFLLERMHPDWLIEDDQLRAFKWTIGWIVGIGVGIISFLSSVSDLGMVVGLLVAILNGLFFGGVAVFISGMKSEDISKIFGKIFEKLGDEDSEMIWDNSGADLRIKLYLIDSVTWDWQQAKKWVGFCLIIGSIFGLISGLVNGTVLWLFSMRSIGVGVSFVFGLAMGICYGWIYGMVGILISGLKVRQVDRVTRPGEKLLFFFRNFVFVGLGFGLTGMISFQLLNSLKNWLVSTFMVGAPLGIWSSWIINGSTGELLIWLSLGVVFGLIFGGYTLLQHYILRLILALYHLLPLRLIPFLDHCVDLIFLRRVGGGYIFVHRLLMEHFAEMDEETINRLAGIDNA